MYVETGRNSKREFVMAGIIMQLVAKCSEFKGLSVLNNSILHYYVTLLLENSAIKDIEVTKNHIKWED